jgi:hypothetical protein
MTTPRCWYCSEDLRPTDRAKVVADLSVTVHAACFDKLYATEGPRSWSNDRRTGDPGAARNDDEEEAHPT